MTRLFRDAVHAESPSGRRMPVAKGRNTTRGHAADILTLILDGRLPWVGRIGDANRYEHLLIDVDEVVAIRRAGGSRVGLVATDAMALIPGVTKGGIGRLARAGLIARTTEFCPGGMRTQHVMTREGVEAFAAEYVSVAEIGDATNVHPKVVARRLREAGIDEAIDRAVSLTPIFRRQDVAAARIFKRWPPGRS